MKFKKKWLKLFKNWTKLKINSQWDSYTVYSNNNVNYYKFIKLWFEKDFIDTNYDLKLIRNYNSLEIELAILIIETESMSKQEKLDDVVFLKFYDKKTKIGYYKILKTEKDKLEKLETEYKREKIELKETAALEYQDNLMKNNEIQINPDIIYNEKKSTISYLWNTFIREKDKYWPMYNYIRIILENENFTTIEKQFFISFIKDFKRLSQDERVFFIHFDSDDIENSIRVLVNKKNELYQTITEKPNFSVISHKGKNKTTDLEDLIIDSKILNNIEIQNYLVLINSMNNEELYNLEQKLKK